MALDAVVTGGASTANQGNVTATYEQLVALAQVLNQSGYVLLACENDAGTITGSKERKTPRCSDDSRLSVGMDTPMFEDSFSALAQNTKMWKFFSLSSLIATQSGGYLNLNPTQVVTSGGVVSMVSYRHMTVTGNTSLHVEFAGAFGTANTPLANQIIEFGLFVPPATAIAPTDGVFFRYTSAGLNGLMVNNSGAETGISVPRACSNFSIDTNYHFKMVIGEDFVDFYVDNIEIGSFAVPAGFGSPFLSGALPLAMFARNTALISGTNGTYLKISDTHVDSLDMDTGKTFAQIYGGMGRHGSATQNGQTGFGLGAGVMGSTSNITNSAAIGTPAALSNTTCAAPACTGLGGISTYLPTLAVFNDGILMSWQNPVGTVNIQPRTVIIGSIRINSIVSATLTGGAIGMHYYLAYGHTAISLATAEATSFTTGGGKAPIRINLGTESIVAAATIGTGANGGVNIILSAPICINPGEFVAIVAKNVGVVTSAGSVSACIGIGSWHE